MKRRHLSQQEEVIAAAERLVMARRRIKRADNAVMLARPGEFTVQHCMARVDERVAAWAALSEAHAALEALFPQPEETNDG